MADRTYTAIFGSGAAGRFRPAIVRYLGSTAAMAVTIISQLVMFVFLARYLGAGQFGLFVTITAATNLGLNLCGLGCGETCVRRLARNSLDFPDVLGHSLILTGASGAALSLIVVAGMQPLITIAPTFAANAAILAVFAVSNIVLFRLILVAEQIFLGLRQYGMANAVLVGFGVLRAATVVCATVGAGVDRLDTWAGWYGASHLVGVLGCAILLRPYGRPRWHLLGKEIPLGIHFSTSYFFSTLVQNLDRLVLSMVAMPAVVGAYGVASRMVSTSVVTVNAFSRILYPRLARDGHSSPRRVWSTAVLAFPASIGIGLATSFGLHVIAPYLPLIFGKDFGDTIAYLQIMCWLVLVSGAINVPYDALGALERHALRAHIFNIAGVLGAISMVALTFLAGIAGMLAAIFLTQIGMAAVAWLTLYLLTRKAAR